MGCCTSSPVSISSGFSSENTNERNHDEAIKNVDKCCTHDTNHKNDNINSDTHHYTSLVRESSSVASVDSDEPPDNNDSQPKLFVNNNNSDNIVEQPPTGDHVPSQQPSSSVRCSPSPNLKTGCKNNNNNNNNNNSPSSVPLIPIYRASGSDSFNSGSSTNKMKVVGNNNPNDTAAEEQGAAAVSAASTDNNQHLIFGQSVEARRIHSPIEQNLPHQLFEDNNSTNASDKDKTKIVVSSAQFALQVERTATFNSLTANSSIYRVNAKNASSNNATPNSSNYCNNNNHDNNSRKNNSAHAAVSTRNRLCEENSSFGNTSSDNNRPLIRLSLRDNNNTTTEKSDATSDNSLLMRGSIKIGGVARGPEALAHSHTQNPFNGSTNSLIPVVGQMYTTDTGSPRLINQGEDITPDHLQPEGDERSSAANNDPQQYDSNIIHDRQDLQTGNNNNSPRNEQQNDHENRTVVRNFTTPKLLALDRQNQARITTSSPTNHAQMLLSLPPSTSPSEFHQSSTPKKEIDDLHHECNQKFAAAVATATSLDQEQQESPTFVSFMGNVGANNNNTNNNNNSINNNSNRGSYLSTNHNALIISNPGDSDKTTVSSVHSNTFGEKNSLSLLEATAGSGNVGQLVTRRMNSSGSVSSNNNDVASPMKSDRSRYKATVSRSGPLHRSGSGAIRQLENPFVTPTSSTTTTTTTTSHGLASNNGATDSSINTNTNSVKGKIITTSNHNNNTNDNSQYAALPHQVASSSSQHPSPQECTKPIEPPSAVPFLVEANNNNNGSSINSNADLNENSRGSKNEVEEMAVPLPNNNVDRSVDEMGIVMCSPDGGRSTPTVTTTACAPMMTSIVTNSNNTTNITNTHHFSTSSSTQRQYQKSQSAFTIGLTGASDSDIGGDTTAPPSINSNKDNQHLNDEHSRHQCIINNNNNNVQPQRRRRQPRINTSSSSATCSPPRRQNTNDMMNTATEPNSEVDDDISLDLRPVELFNGHAHVTTTDEPQQQRPGAVIASRTRSNNRSNNNSSAPSTVTDDDNNSHKALDDEERDHRRGTDIRIGGIARGPEAMALSQTQNPFETSNSLM